MQQLRQYRVQQTGLSLIELMIAMLIGLLLVIGMIQIFGASRATYQMQDGLSRVQESGRFATQYLQRQLRMVGYMGCGSDVERTTQASFVNHLATYSAALPGGDAVPPLYRFQRPIEAFSADDLPSYLDALNLQAVAGTSVLVLRIAGTDAVPVMSVNQTSDGLGLTIGMGSNAPAVFTGAAGNSVVYMLESCRSADVFVGNLGGATLPTMTVAGTTGLNVYRDPAVTSCSLGSNCPWDFRISNVFLNAPAGGIVDGAPSVLQLNAQMHRAEYKVMYVARNSTNKIPSLFVRELKRDGVTLDSAQELAEGIDNLQLLFGVDSDANGQVDKYQTAAEVVSGAGTESTRDASWRNVLSVRVGMLLRSPERAGVSGTEAGGVSRTFKVLDTTITPDDDGAMRQVYETTIALRNRIYNS